ncbi:MAG: hypothetical protein K2N34_00665, partial [Lachnospiraceae bacterium]|nr:hypothetical protein [Lachnospiraceae bacterium]
FLLKFSRDRIDQWQFGSILSLENFDQVKYIRNATTTRKSIFKSISNKEMDKQVPKYTEKLSL